MKRLLFLAGIVVAGTAVVCGGIWLYLCFPPQAMLEAARGGIGPADSPPPPPMKMTALPDADALASRMPHHQEIYRKVRDEALAAYAQHNPVAKASDEEARAELRLIAYLDVWQDFYGEGLWPQVSLHANNLLEERNEDPTWQLYYDVEKFQGHYSNTEAGAQTINGEMIAYSHTDYPALFKLKGDETAINNLLTAHADAAVHLDQSYKGLPDQIALAVAEYRKLVEAHYDPTFLCFTGEEFLDGVKADEQTLEAVSLGLDQAFAVADKDDPAARVLDGVFFTDYAWCARGSDYASTVTPEGWQLFNQRLNRANDILTGVEAKTPGLYMTARAMMTVVLGLQEPRDQMELWFQRGIKADPENFNIYMLKRWYLMPRWYGSDEELWKFGLEYAGSTNWQAKIPMILVESISDAAENDPSVYAKPEIWQPVEKVYREYLKRYPNSVEYRSRFAKSAVQGEHWDVAKEQFKILGRNWDRSVFEDNEYAQMSQAANSH
jgi:hypothetical protein